MTKGDGAHKLELKGKDEIANNTTSMIFRLLNYMGIPTHYIRKLSKISFLAYRLTMFPLEIVIRRWADGSCVDRGEAKKGDRLLYKREAFLKIKHDPILIKNRKGRYLLYDAHKPISEQPRGKPIPKGILMPTEEELELMFETAEKVFKILEAFLAVFGLRLKDLKLEFGKDCNGKLRVGDVIDNDSWRVEFMTSGIEMSKQAYRDAVDSGTEITSEVKENLKNKFEQVEKIISKFWGIRVELKKKLSIELGLS